jgi:hypothetical protein
VIDNQGYVGINNSLPVYLLDVNGNVNFNGNATTTGYLVIGATNPTNDILAGDLLIGSNATTSGSHYIGGDFSVLGNASTTGWLNIDQYLIVDQYGQFNNVTTTDTLAAGGYATTTGGFYTQGDIHGGGNLTVDGNATTTGSFTVGTDYLFVDKDSGNIGIGMAIPTRRLHIVDNTTNEALRVENPTTNGEGIYATANNDGIKAVTTGSGAALRALADGSNGYAISATIGANRTNVTGLYVASAGAGASSKPLFEIYHSNSTLSGDVIKANVIAGGLGSFTGNLLNLQINDLTKLLVDSSGNVGIGTTSPDHILHISGGAFCVDDANGTCGSQTLGTGDAYIAGNATTTGSLNVDGDFLTDGTGSFANAALTIDASGNLNTTGYASTTTYLNTQGDSHIGGNLTVEGTLSFPADSIDDNMVVDTITASNYLALTNWYATTTWAGSGPLTVVGDLNATTTNIGTLHIYTDFTTDDTGLVSNFNADKLDDQHGTYYLDYGNINDRWGTTSEQNFWNTTSTWAGFQSEFDDKLTSSLPRRPGQVIYQLTAMRRPLAP